MNGDEKTQHPVPAPVTAPVAVEEASGHSGEGAGLGEAERRAASSQLADPHFLRSVADELVEEDDVWTNDAARLHAIAARLDTLETDAAQAIAERDAALAEVGRLRDGITALDEEYKPRTVHSSPHVSRAGILKGLRALLAPADGSGS